MTKFGELIKGDAPILFGFYEKSKTESESLETIFDEVLQKFKKRVRIYKIEASENQKLLAALKVDYFPTVIIFKEGEMLWRKNKTVNVDEIIEVLTPVL